MSLSTRLDRVYAAKLSKSPFLQSTQFKIRTMIEKLRDCWKSNGSQVRTG